MKKMIISRRISTRFYVFCWTKDKKIAREKKKDITRKAIKHFLRVILITFPCYLSRSQSSVEIRGKMYEIYISVAMLQVVKLSTNRNGKNKRDDLSFFTSSKIQLRWITRRVVASSPCNKRHMRRRQRGRGRLAASAIHVRWLSEKCMVCWKIRLPAAGV